MYTRTARIARRRPRRSSAARLAQPDSSAREPQSSAIAGAGEREPPEEQSSGSHRARIRCSTEFAGWPDRADDRHRAGKSQNRTAEPRLQHPPVGDAATDGCSIRESVPDASQAGARRTKQSLLTTNYEPKSPLRRAGDRSDEKLVIVRGALLAFGIAIQRPTLTASILEFRRA